MLSDLVQNPSAWESAYNSSTSKLKIRLRIYRTSSAYVDYNASQLLKLRLKAAALDSGFALGQFYSGEIDFELLDRKNTDYAGFNVNQNIPAMARCELYLGYEDISEMIKYGEYFVDTRNDNRHSTSFVAFDRTLMFENPFPTGYTFPMTYRAFVAACCTKTHTTNNATWSISNTDTIDAYPEGKTMREVLGYIAAGSGGNFAITPRGLTLIKPFMDYQADTIPLKWAYGKDTSQRYPYVQYVKMNKDSETSYLAGTDPEQNDVYGLTIDNPYATQAITTSVYNYVQSKQYVPFVFNDIILSPLTELGDVIEWRYYDEDQEDYEYEYIPIMLMDMDLGVSLKGDAGSPGNGELTHEYTYDGADSLVHSKEYDSTTGNGYYGGYGSGGGTDPRAVHLNKVYGGNLWIDENEGAHIGLRGHFSVDSNGHPIFAGKEDDLFLPFTLRMYPRDSASMRQIIVLTETEYYAGGYEVNIGDVVAVIPDPVPSNNE